jgi:hypothetical protein
MAQMMRVPARWSNLGSRASGADHSHGVELVMEKISQCECSYANGTSLAPSLLKKAIGNAAARFWRIPLPLSAGILSLAILLSGCGSEAPKPAVQVEAKTVEPAIPEEIQEAAKTLLGSESQVLAFGDLAKNGRQAFLAANVVPKTPTNNLPGTIVTRAVVAENSDGKWAEVLRCDEHLKNQRGFLALTPLSQVTGWRLQFEQSAMKGLELYFTPLKGTTDSHVLPIGVRWNPATKRYQSLDRTYEHFLLEATSLEDVRSTLR